VGQHSRTHALQGVLAISAVLIILKRYVSDRELFEKLVEESLKLKTTRTAIGGNAPVIANRMAREGAKVVLGGQESDDMKEGFPYSQ